jgi:fluoride exporter
MIKDILYVGTGSALGGIARLLINRGITHIFNYPFPLATFLINITGSFLIGYIYASSIKYEWLTSSALLFLVTGICGGFTTFSAFSYENFMLVRNGHLPLSLLYIFASVLLGIGAALLGFWVGK